MERFAPAKLNLTLDVLGKRPDGYHDLKMVMQSITLGDTLTLEPGGEGVRVQTRPAFPAHGAQEPGRRRRAPLL